MCILSQDYPSVKEARGWLDYLKEEEDEDDKVVLDGVRSRTRTGVTWVATRDLPPREPS